LAESVEWGVREYYFTGGEPFLNPELVEMLVRALEYGPATVLTNATVLKDEWLERLREAEENGRSLSAGIHVMQGLTIDIGKRHPDLLMTGKGGSTVVVKLLSGLAERVCLLAIGNMFGQGV
jgi:pyruvate-formate lyase-activating enzyme